MNTPSTPPEPTASTFARWRTTDWWYLGFLSMLLFQPTFDPGSGTFAWVVTGVTIALFVPFYLHVNSHPHWRFATWAPAISALAALAVFPVNSGSTVLLVYAAGFVGPSRPRRDAFRWFVGLSLVGVGLGLVAPLPMPFALVAFAFGVPIVFVWVVGLATMEEAAREREAARLRIDNVRIAHLSTATERERIARDLHDVTGHTLTSIVVRAQLVSRLVHTDPERAAKEAYEIEQTARTALSEIRETVGGWRQVSLDDELVAARDALTTAGVELRVDREADLRLAPSVEHAFGLAIREAVTNVLRHAHARHCTVTLEHRDDALVLEVCDDGDGHAGPDGNGLVGMGERMAALGGKVERLHRDGTRLTVSVPAQVTG